MLNNKAQSLVIFVLFLPIVMLFLSYVFDIISINYQKSKMDNLYNMISEQLKVDEDLEVCELVSKNDSSIICTVSEDEIELKKRIKSLFLNITENDYYEIKNVIKK